MNEMQCLGVSLGMGIIAALASGRSALVFAAVLLFANWLLWSSAVLASESWEPVRVALGMDAVTAIMLRRYPGLFNVTVCICVLHFLRMAEWMEYEIYYSFGWQLGMLQVFCVIEMAASSRRARRVGA